MAEQRDLVERRGWFTKDEYMKSLSLSQLAPGPLTAEVAICLGYVHSRVAGAMFLPAGVVAVVAHTPPAWLRRSAPACLSVVLVPDVLTQIFWFFAQAGAFVFGSGMASYPSSMAVQEYRWLDDRQFIDAVAVAMLTPEPIVVALAFIGFPGGELPEAMGAAIAGARGGVALRDSRAAGAAAGFIILVLRQEVSS